MSAGIAKRSRYEGVSYVVLISPAAQISKRAHVWSDEMGEAGKTLCGHVINGYRNRHGEDCCKRCEARAAKLES